MDFEFWTPLEPPEPLRELRDRFLGWGSVVEHHLFAVTGEVDREAHFRAAVSGLEAQLHWAADYHGGPLSWRAENMFNWEAIRMERGWPCSREEFFGPNYDIEKRLVSARMVAPDPNESAIGKTLIMSENVVNSGAESETSLVLKIGGYIDAVLRPPYRLFGAQGVVPVVTRATIEDSFQKMIEELFGDPSTIEVMEWDDDFSDYFKPGLEWWGAYFWTVWAPQKNWIVTILASATD